MIIDFLMLALVCRHMRKMVIASLLTLVCPPYDLSEFPWLPREQGKVAFCAPKDPLSEGKCTVDVRRVDLMAYWSQMRNDY